MRWRTLQEWQAYVLRCRVAHLYRIAGDGNGGWVVTRPGSSERLHFPAHDHFTHGSNVEVNAAEAMQAAPSRDAQGSSLIKEPATSHADQWDAAVRGSHPDFN